MDQDTDMSLFEGALTLAEATKALAVTGGKRPATSTLWRWCRRGLRGIKLDYVRMGRRILTSRDALDRFSKALAELDDHDQEALAPSSEGGGRGRSRSRTTRAHAELSREGL